MRNHTSRRRPKPRSGFALIIALVLMGFMIMCLLSLSSLTQVQIQHTATQSEQDLARKNALLALNVALGQLQQLTGPDQRITAPASIYSGSGRAPAPAEDNLNRIGVWRTDNWDATAPQARSFLGWLASGDDMETLESITIEPAQNAITLLQTYDENGAAVPVKADAVQIGTNGAYAYWIADESLKASLMLEDPLRGQAQANATADILRRNIAVRNDLNQLALLNDFDFDTDNWSTAVQNIIEWDALPVLNSADADWVSLTRNKRHDFTLNARGLLTDTRKGGFRRDLTLAFTPSATGTQNSVFNTHLRSSRVINNENFEYLNASRFNPSDRKFYGPRWESLQDYYGLWKTIGQSGETNIHRDSMRYDKQGNNSTLNIASNDWLILRNGGNTSLDTMHALGSIAQPGQPIGRINGFPVEFINSPVVPVPTYAATFYMLKSVEVPPPASNPTAAPTYELQFSFYPILQLWNPYNVRIASVDSPTSTQEDIRFRISATPHFKLTYSANAGATDQEMRINTGIGGLARGNLDRSVFNFPLARGVTSTVGNRATEYFFDFNDAPLEPGEVRVFALGASETDTPSVTNIAAANASVNRHNPMTSDWNPSAEMEVPTSRFLMANASNQSITLKLDDQIRIQTFIPPTSIPAGSSTNYDASASYVNVRPGWMAPDQGYVATIEQIYPTDSYSFDDIFLVSDLLNSPVHIGGIEVYLKPGNVGEPNTGILSQYNPAALFKGYHAGDGPHSRNIVAKVVDWTLPHVAKDMTKNKTLGFWGNGIDSQGQSFLPIFDIPRAPLHSLAQLQHANISLFDNLPAYAIGNSMAPAEVGKTQGVTYTNNRTFIDYSWMLNHELWDSYYFSTIPEANSQNPLGTGTFDDAYVKAGGRLPNARYSIHLQPDATFDALYDYDLVSAQLAVDGAFNVNSTSVEAWKSVLASLGGAAFNHPVAESGNTANSGPLNNPFFRHSMPMAGQGQEFQAGWSDLSDTQIDRLANAIVDEVKKRGPFMNLGDFVNRRLANDETGEMGALQAAIEEAGINSGWPSQMTKLAPGTLSQADVLTAIGPFITVRGDTFLIRAYGSVRDGNGNTISEAWLEATAQRTPHDSGSVAGRQFAISSFRWLSKDEL